MNIFNMNMNMNEYLVMDHKLIITSKTLKHHMINHHKQKQMDGFVMMVQEEVIMLDVVQPTHRQHHIQLQLQQQNDQQTIQLIQHQDQLNHQQQLNQQVIQQLDQQNVQQDHQHIL